MMPSNVAIAQDLVLIGGGHSHAIVLRLWGMHPIPGVRLTLISDGSDTPYSGMLPGYVAGVYSRSDCHIDLRSLCQFAGAQFYRSTAIGLDLAQQQVICVDRPPVRFDWLSIDIGSTPQTVGPQTAGPQTVGVGEPVSGRSNSIPAKPVPQFLQWWERFCAQYTTAPTAPTISIVGGGVGGVELALSIQTRLQALRSPAAVGTIQLFSRSPTVLPQHNQQVQRYFQQYLQQRQIKLYCDREIIGWNGKTLQTANGEEFASDVVVWVTVATAPAWLAASGLAVDGDGFIQVDQYLRSPSHPNIFAAGDIASMMAQPRPKAGVFAVRQGGPLYHNLCRSLQGRSLKPFRPQTQYLSLIGTGDGSAVASRGPWFARSPILWRWKQRIDRQFMQQFSPAQLHQQSVTEVMIGAPRSVPIGSDFATNEQQPAPIPCSGCAAKVGSRILTQTLSRIKADYPQLLRSLNRPDDGAVIEIPAGKILVQTVDYFPSLINDPYIFGQIATHHSLSDIFAMGAVPHSALAIAAIPPGGATAQSETLFQLLSGAVTALAQSNTQLVGGHTLTADQLMFGLSSNGFADRDQILAKVGMRLGDGLILTQAIGIGTLFAAAMQGRAEPQWIDHAIATMLQSNYRAAQIFYQYGATACTDITGFGLAGHVLEMIPPELAVELYLDRLPILPGAQTTTAEGIVSSLYGQNSQVVTAIANHATMAKHPHFPLLFDPQTSGGLVASIPADAIAACLNTLHQAGYADSACIGSVTIANDRTNDRANDDTNASTNGRTSNHSILLI
jgi:selenide, water dikinase